MGDDGGRVYHAPPALVDVADNETSGEHAVLAKNTSLLSRCFLSKPLSVVHAEEVEGVLERRLGFWDLFALGFGGTIGSGVFVMAGLICHDIAGPAATISWLVAGFGCLLSAMSFAELSWRVPSAGGAYAYAFVALGELPAAVVGWCMTLEYGISGAAVAKSWGEMLSVGLTRATDHTHASGEGLEEGGGPSLFGAAFDIGGVYAALLQGACVMVVVGGLEASKYTVNTFCLAKALLVVFMTGMAFSLWNADNLVPLAPFGASGVLQGAVAAFFGFLGFDEVVLLAPEAKNPAKHVPRALFASLFAVAVVCAMASASLSGALAAPDLDPDSAFAEVFRARGMMVAYKITAIGELATLPLVVLVSFMAQPRLLFAMAKDGLLPRLFSEVDSRGTLLKGSLVSGGVCMVTALLVPFDSLNTIISAGVLLAFNLVTSSLLVLRHRSSRGGQGGATRVLVANLMACASAGVALAASNSGGASGPFLATVAAGLGVVTCYVVSGLQSHATTTRATDISGGNFLSPFFPWPQALALWVNWFLVCQLPLRGLLALLAYVAFAVGHYACYGATRSVGNCTGWSVLLSAAASSARTTGSSRCLSLSADSLENALMAGDDDSQRDRLSPTAEQPLLAPLPKAISDSLGLEQGVPGTPGGGSGRGGGGGGSGSLAPPVTVMPNAQQAAPTTTMLQHGQRQVVRRRSPDNAPLHSSD